MSSNQEFDEHFSLSFKKFPCRKHIEDSTEEFSLDVLSDVRRESIQKRQEYPIQELLNLPMKIKTVHIVLNTYGISLLIKKFVFT